MKIDRSMRIDIPADEVYEMSTSQDYQEQKCRDAGALSYSVRISEGPTGAIISARRKLPTVGFPGLLKKFVPAGVVSTETVTWRALAGDGTRTADLSVDFHGSPAAMNGTIKVVPEGDAASTITIHAEFKANIPLVGGKIESFAAPIILGVIDSEEATGKAWAQKA